MVCKRKEYVYKASQLRLDYSINDISRTFVRSSRKKIPVKTYEYFNRNVST